MCNERDGFHALGPQIILAGNPSHPIPLCLSTENSNNPSKIEETLNYIPHLTSKGAEYRHGYWHIKINKNKVFV